MPAAVVQIKASRSGDAQGAHGRQGLMSICGSERPLRLEQVRVRESQHNTRKC